MLCDLRKIHIGSKVVPKVTHTSDDESWGKVGGYRKVFMAKAFGFKGGYAALDTVLERDENKHWKIEITDIKSQSLGLYKFQGEWDTIAINNNHIKIIYSYSMFSKNALLYPIQWLFVKLVWRKYMRQVLSTVQILAEGNEPYQYD